jgi:hypothetical protein
MKGYEKDDNMSMVKKTILGKKPAWKLTPGSAQWRAMCDRALRDMRAASIMKPTGRKPKVNKLFPGRPHYVGPQHGYFAMLHHEVLFEKTTSGGINDRVSYVIQCKRGSEVKVRLRNMLSLHECTAIDVLLDLDDMIAGAPGGVMQCRVGYVRKRVRQLLEKEVLAYIKRVMPDHSWNTRLHKIKGT